MHKSVTHCGAAWACACTIYEIATGEPLFPGESVLDQIVCIAKLLGPPPVDYRYGWYPRWKSTYPNYAPTIDKFRKKLEPHKGLADLLLHMLDYNLGQRYTVFDALKDPYFSEEAKTKVEKALGLTKVLPNEPTWIRSADVPLFTPEYVMDVLDSKLANCRASGLCLGIRPQKESEECAAAMLKYATKLGHSSLEVAHLGLMIYYAIHDKLSGTESKEVYAACYRLADRYRSVYPGDTDVYTRTCGCTATALIACEDVILEKLDYDIYFPTAYDYLVQVRRSQNLTLMAFEEHRLLLLVYLS